MHGATPERWPQGYDGRRKAPWYLRARAIFWWWMTRHLCGGYWAEYWGLRCEVLEAADGVSAMGAIQKGPPALIILDLLMPQISGTQLCRWIQRNAATKGIPVLMCTAHHERKTLDRAIKAGATDIRCKPVTKAAIAERVEKHLRVSA